ncbi:hypothetical protein D1007_08142 [Hordeum vulgare]|nr:hypothetical protein D1007_08142 [Hordeum vulgare]
MDGVTRPASLFLDGLKEPEPFAALFFFAETLPFFVCAAYGSCKRGARGFTAGTYARPPAAEVIRGGMKRPRATPMLGGAAVAAKPKLPALGVAAATAMAASSEESRV